MGAVVLSLGLSSFWLGGFFEPLHSALPAGVLSFASPKESNQRKGDRRVDAGLCPVPCATRQAGRLAKLACGSDRRQPKAPGQPALLGVSKAGIKTTRFLTVFRVHRRRLASGRFSTPLEGAEQRRRWRTRGEDCLRGAAPSSAAPRQRRVAQGTGVAGTDPGVAFFLATFSWRSKKKYARPQGGTQWMKTHNHRRSANISRNRFGAGFNGARTDVHAPCFDGVSQLKRLVSHDTARYIVGER